LAERNLARLSEQTLERHGDHESLFFEGEWHRSARLHERARRLALGLRDVGVDPGDRVVVLMANCPEVGIAYNALWRIGAVVTPAIFLLPPPELRHIVEDSEARVVIATPEFADTARQASPEARVISTDEFAELESGGESPIVERSDDDLAALMYTGGTTGRAKGVMLSHENLWLCGKVAEEAGHVPGIVRSLTSLPLSHAFGLLVTCVGLQATEPSRHVLMRWFDPERWLELAQEHRTQIVAVVPSMLHLLLRQPLEDYDLSELRYIASGAAPLAPEVVQELARRLPTVELREGYGLTETSALVSTTRPGHGRAGSVGQPVAGMEVQILDDEDAEVPTGEVGEICCRSALVMRGYWRAPEQSEETMRGGWLHTGDLGRVDEDGYLYVVDRKKDLIIRSGFNVFPRDVEEALLEHAAVEAAAVVGRPDPKCGEEVVAFVALREEVDPAELVAWARTRIGGYKYPREVHVVPAIPLTPVGKIDRRALRARLHEKVGA
jgi:long-chain acyl-CoA synthetase